ncbi:MAG: hypothetical protein GF308_16935 [Candidatus Heimdallarchaeota archaeon]|nr:hypothetical protein [Candidatus Heimdallarchaeota archaeon]
MSENIDCNLSIGVTEAGTIGEDFVIGVLSIKKEDETKIIINNLLSSDHLISITGEQEPSSKSVGPNKINRQKYISKLIRDNSIKIGLFRFQPQEQFKILQEISILEGKKLYEISKSIDATNYQYIAKSLQLRYHFPKLYTETFMKSLLQYYALNTFIKNYECGHVNLFKGNILDEKRMAIHIIVDGGAQYSSYQDILNDNLKNFWSQIKNQEASDFYWNLMVATHGIADAYLWYPMVSSIKFITSNLQDNLDLFIYSGNTLKDIKAEDLLSQEDIVGKSMVEILHEQYIERTGSTFRPPKLWRIGDFTNLGEYRQTLPYLLLQKSIKEKRITAREIDDSVENIDRFYQYNNPLERDCFLVGEISDQHLPLIHSLNELGIEGKTIIDEDIIEEYQLLLNEIRDYIQSEECVIYPNDQQTILDKISAIEETDFQKINETTVPDIF